MGVWSFDAMKTLSTGDGGMIYLKSEALKIIAEETLYLGLPTKQKSGIDSSTSNTNWWEFEMNRPGRRAIMNNITAAIGCIQLKKLDNFIEKREKIYNQYMNAFSDIEWLRTPPSFNGQIKSSYYFFWVQTKKRDELARYLLNNGVYSTFRYWPLNKVKLFRKYVDDSNLRNTDYISSNTLNIPLHHSLSDDEVSKIIDLIRSF